MSREYWLGEALAREGFPDGTRFETAWQPMQDRYVAWMMTGRLYSYVTLDRVSVQCTLTAERAMTELTERKLLHLRQLHWMALAHARGGYS